MFASPSNEPTIAIAVIVENGGSGSEIAVPVEGCYYLHLGREADFSNIWRSLNSER